ncbi:MAG: hypothetical protein PHX82_00710 [Paracoccaceae bacterium]|jgi:hypothetical protein|nr:hypothetical protein [Paracoccaceae bacterium]
MFMNPLAPWLLSFEATRIGMEAQAVIALRVAGMAGLWDTSPEEMTRMVSEKPQAVVEAIQAATHAALSGHSADKVMQAGMREIGRHTSGNVKRLSEMGPTRHALLW